MVGTPVDPEGEMATAEEEDVVALNRSGVGALHVVGTASEKNDEDRPYVLEEYSVSGLLNHSKLFIAPCKLVSI